MGKKTSHANKLSVENTETPSPSPSPVEETPTEVVATTVPVVEKKERKKRTKKTVVVVPTEEEVKVDVNAETVVCSVVDDTKTLVEDVVENVVEDVVEDVVVEEDTTTTTTPTDKKKRRLVTKETFLKTSEELQTELAPILEENKKLAKMFKGFLNDAYRLLKIKTHQKKQKDATNSGFMRPVKPSIALEKFLAHIGENSTQPLTRAHLTTIICKYIKENDLQNPQDRRIIFPDEEFKKLFQITDNETEPLTYYNIQKRIQSHVSRIEV